MTTWLWNVCDESEKTNYTICWVYSIITFSIGRGPSQICEMSAIVPKCVTHPIFLYMCMCGFCAVIFVSW